MADGTLGGAAGVSRAGVAMVLGSALVWSVGGALARYLETPDPWTAIFWRSLFAAAFLLAFLLWREGAGRTLVLLRGMGAAALLVAVCFATASTSFVVALQFTTVANILFFQAGVPLIAALIGWAALGERVDGATWVAIVAVIGGIALMVSEGFGAGGGASLAGMGLAVLTSLAFAVATVTARAGAGGVPMVPAVLLGTVLAGAVAAFAAGGLAVGAADLGVLFAFGALNLGLGLALFVSGMRLVPAALAALLGMAEPVLGPVWVWLVHGEVPSLRTLQGGAVVLVALAAHILWQARRGRAA